VQRHAEGIIRRVAVAASEALRHPVGVAVCAAAGDLGAAGCRIPAFVRPLNGGRHSPLPAEGL
jgi:hypothetical protein